jgi:F-type H+-transporting ATPase subunit b
MNPITLFLLAQVWAAEGAEHHDAASITGLIFPLINFLLYAGILVFFVFPLVRDFLRSRRDQVLTAVNEAAAHRQRAEALVDEYKIRLAKLDQESKAIQEELRIDGEREKARLLSEAEVLAAKIKTDAQFLAEQETKLANQQVRQDMAEAARATAVELVQRHLSGADRIRLMDEAIQEIGQVR